MQTEEEAAVCTMYTHDIRWICKWDIQKL